MYPCDQFMLEDIKTHGYDTILKFEQPNLAAIKYVRHNHLCNISEHKKKKLP